jgi:hypothetical protein
VSTTNIPARTVVVCDVCRVECDKGNQRQNGKLHINRAALDHHGHAVASDNIDLDLCDLCLGLVVKAINGVKDVR